MALNHRRGDAIALLDPRGNIARCRSHVETAASGVAVTFRQAGRAEDPMQTIIIGATFLMGVVLVLVAAFALFRKKLAAGKGSLKLGGIELSGTGSHILFLLVGAVLLMSGFGWASTQKAR
ncbi:MAG: hypothetical protein ACREID_10040, partial [Planctomycetota bacterium]